MVSVSLCSSKCLFSNKLFFPEQLLLMLLNVFFVLTSPYPWYFWLLEVAS